MRVEEKVWLEFMNIDFLRSSMVEMLLVSACNFFHLGQALFLICLTWLEGICKHEDVDKVRTACLHSWILINFCGSKCFLIWRRFIQSNLKVGQAGIIWLWFMVRLWSQFGFCNNNNQDRGSNANSVAEQSHEMSTLIWGSGRLK